MDFCFDYRKFYVILPDKYQIIRLLSVLSKQIYQADSIIGDIVMVNEKHSFCAIIEEGQGGGAFVNVPLDVEKIFGKKRVKIKAVIDGEPYRGILVRMGSPCYILGVLKEIRAKIGKNVGDQVFVVIKEDLEERVIEVPEDLKQRLSENREAGEFFKKLSYTHQKEYVKWIEEAKREETREARLVKTIEMLNKGIKTR